MVEFLARQIAPDALADFQSSEATRARVWQLVHKEREEGLTPDEKCELDEYEQLEHLLILTRAKVRSQSGHA